MTEPRIDAPVMDEPPRSDQLTDYDRLHLITYLRLLDAAAAKADPDDVARIVLRIDAKTEPKRARHAYKTHLARARWMTKSGYRHLLRDATH
jgi:hypothetical protein